MLYLSDTVFFSFVFFLPVDEVFVEKVLRVQPEVRKLYLLMRASDAISAAERLQSEVLRNRIFIRVSASYIIN